MKISRSELKDLIREVLHEELAAREPLEESSASTDPWTDPEAWDETNAPEEAYAILTDDGAGYENVFLAFDNASDCYTTVDYFDDINRQSICKSIPQAEQIAKDADSTTWGGWPTAMHIIKVTNFRDAYFSGADPEYTIEKTIKF
jgi:hypothetical protein